MQASDWKGFTDLMTTLAEYYRQEPLTTRAMRLMFDALSDLPLDGVAYAVQKHVSGVCGNASRFCPNAADLRLSLCGTPEQQACEAWVKVQEAIRKLHSDSSVRFDNPAYHYAIKACGGWVGLCRMEPERAEPLFRRYFIVGLQRGSQWGDPDVPEYLCGNDEIRACEVVPWDRSMIKSIETARHVAPLPQIGGR